ncbi:hypothetical protein FQR65_LT17949 [Abscondita terminalis]|nr:hypothetical protein FQR65_LT17949 [Abscondita terminalis]
MAFSPVVSSDSNYVVTDQPIPKASSNSPLGLEYLASIDQLEVYKLKERSVDDEILNVYTIKNTLGQQIYSTGENCNYWALHCCGRFRTYEMKIYNTSNSNHIMSFKRRFTSTSSCCSCFMESMEIWTPSGAMIGSVQQQCANFLTFNVQNSNEDVVFRMKGRTKVCGGDTKFKIFTPNNNNRVGDMIRQYGGFVRESGTYPTRWLLSFPIDLDVNLKATLIGGLFLLELLLFDKHY